ncbi:MAG: phosphoribosylaminoimidazolesuccinocarboxamide synthase [Candidatus Paceibacterota bacterium]
MNKIPKRLQNDALSTYLKKEGLTRIHQGKVRDTYSIDGDHLLVVATDRISIFDFVLNALVPKKGEVLTALTHFWLTNLLSEFNHHLIKTKETDLLKRSFNGAYDLKGRLPDLPIECCLVVKNLAGKLYPFEMIYRHHIGGSVFKKYQETGIAGGQNISPNLPKWSKLDKPIFTPSTKEEVGHDINVDALYYFMTMKEKGLANEMYQMVEMLSQVYSMAYSYAEEKGILILDTKMEVAEGLTIIDEILTPDSSRFALKSDWQQALKEGRDPKFLDKQPVRDWGDKIKTPFYEGAEQIIGIKKLDPENPEHVSFVHGLKVPSKIINDTTNRYLKLFHAITGRDLVNYQWDEMGVED